MKLICISQSSELYNSPFCHGATSCKGTMSPSTGRAGNSRIEVSGEEKRQGIPVETALKRPMNSLPQSFADCKVFSCQNYNSCFVLIFLAIPFKNFNFQCKLSVFLYFIYFGPQTLSLYFQLLASFSLQSMCISTVILCFKSQFQNRQKKKMHYCTKAVYSCVSFLTSCQF